MAEKPDISQEFTEIFKLDDLTRTILDRTMFRNLLYYLGEQYIDWVRSTGGIGRRYEHYMDIPTPVSNIIRDTVKSMKALTLNKEFVVRVWPNSEEQKDKDAAELGEYIVQHLENRRDGEAQDVKELVETWRQITGNGFWRTFPDMGGGMYLVDKSGNPIGKTGDVCTECFIPFNVVVPSLGQFLRDKAYVGMKSLKEKEWVEDTFKVLLQAGEGDVAQVDYQKQLMTLIANVSPWKGRGIDAGLLEKDSNKLTLYQEVEWKPNKDYPKGRYAAMAGGTQVIDDDKLPLPVGPNGEWEYTLTHVPYNYTPGTFWATSSIDDLISPQNIINEVDQTLAINRKTLGRPWVLTPIGVTLRRVSERGAHLLAVEYDPRTVTQPPQINRGTPYPNQILDERAIHRQVAQEGAGDPKNVLRGQAPYAGAPGIAIDILREAAEQSHSPDIKRFYRAYSQVKRKELMVVQKVFTEERILKVTGPGNDILVKKFKGSSLHNNTDVRLELSSGASSTNAGRTEMIMNLLQYGFFDPNNTGLTEGLRREILKLLGLSSFEEDTNIHQKRAEYENSVLTGDDMDALKGVALPGPIPLTDPETGEPVLDEFDQPIIISEFPETHDPVFRFDRHDIHIAVLHKLVFSREFRTLPEEKQKYVLGHLDMHEQALAAALDLLRQQQMEEELGGEGGEGGGASTEGAEGSPAPEEGEFQAEPFVGE